MLPILILALLSGAPRVRGGNSNSVIPDGRVRSETRAVTSGGSGFNPGTPSIVWSFPSADSRIPACTSGENCVAQCGVGIRTGSLTAWECKGPTGSSLGTVTDPGTGTIIDSFIPGVKALEIASGADAPKVVSTAIDAIFQASTAHTVLMTGFGRGTTAPAALPYWFDNSNDATGSFVVRSQSGEFRCIDYAIVTGAAVNGDEGWATTVCRRSGGTSYKSSVNDNTAEVTSATPVVGMTGGSNYWFGTREAKDLYLSGPVVVYTFYSDNKTDAQIAVIRSKTEGAYSAGGTLQQGNAQLQGIDNTATTGNVDIMFPGSRLVSASGLLSSKAHTNTWAADPFDVTSWTDVGTPAVTAGTSAGPFYTYRRGNDCSNLADDAAGALEGKQGATAGTGEGYYTASLYLKAGTSGTVTTKARITITVAGGTGTGSCDFTDLTSTPQRKTCTVLAQGGGITSVRPSILVGTAATDTGSVQICHAQIVKSQAAEPPELDNSAHGSTYYFVDPISFPSSALGAKYEVVHTPLWNVGTEWFASGDEYYLFDTSAASNTEHSVAIIMDYTTAGRLLAVVRNASDISDITINGVVLVEGSTYATAIEWAPLGGGKCNVYVRHNICSGAASSCYAETVIGSDITGNAFCPSTPTRMILGNRFSATIPTSAFFNQIRIYGP